MSNSKFAALAASVFIVGLTVSAPLSALAQFGYGGGGGLLNRERRAVETPNTPPATATGTVATADPETGEVLGVAAFSFNQNLYIGLRSNDVMELQKRLRALGFFTFPTDTGYFGPITRAAVQAFQRANGIPATGFVGPLTRAALNADLTADDTATTTDASSTAATTTRPVTLRSLVDMLISLGTIPADKAKRALAQLGSLGN